MIKKSIEDTELRAHLASLPNDSREVFLLQDGQIRLTGLQATGMINQMRANHALGILETLVLGQAFLAGGLLSATVKGNDRIQLNIECGGPIKGISVEAWASGAVRGYLKQVPIPVDKGRDHLDLDQLYGPGFLSVSKLLEGEKAPFTGQIMLQYGNLAKDLAYYYRQSEQIPSMFSLSVQFDKVGRVVGSGALFLQAMPGCKEDILDELQQKSSSLSPIGSLLATGKTINDYVEKEFSQYSVQHLAHQPIGFSCPCSKKAFARHLMHLGDDEQQDILTNGPFPLQLVCHNCNTTYDFGKTELEDLFDHTKGHLT